MIYILQVRVLCSAVTLFLPSNFLLQNDVKVIWIIDAMSISLLKGIMMTFIFSFSGGNVLANQPFHLNWAWVSFIQNEVKVNETAEKLEVRLQRRGFLGETCFISKYWLETSYVIMCKQCRPRSEATEHGI